LACPSKLALVLAQRFAELEKILAPIGPCRPDDLTTFSIIICKKFMRYFDYIYWEKRINKVKVP
jgi:hypothetical protein